MKRASCVIAALAALATAVPAPGQSLEEAAPPPEFFARHRASYMERMEGGIAVFPAQPEIPRNDDAGYPYRQDSDFYYLTGFREPGAVAVLRPEAPAGERFAMFVRPRDPEQEVWTGHRVGVEGARTRFGAGLAWPVDSLAAVLPRLLAGADRVRYDSSEDHPWAHQELEAILTEWEEGAVGRSLLDADEITDELRLVKSEAELDQLRRAIAITTDAHRAAMAAIEPGMYEYEVEALIEYVFRVRGSPRVGFESIVGSGPNATILHYVENDRRMEADDMVVMDIGAEWNYYTADVTRTVPVDGSFSPEQAAIYRIVLDAQEAAIAAVRPGATIADVQNRAFEVVTEGLVEIGLLEGTVEENLRTRGFTRFLMHGISHWIGLDVHDVGAYTVGEEGSRRPRTLEPGMVFSVEPGIYIAEGTEGVDPKWWNMGVRIEDDVVVTEDGVENLSAAAPREIDAIEALMQTQPASIGGSRASISSRRSSSQGGSTSRSPSASAGSSRVMPGPSVANSNWTPPGARK